MISTVLTLLATGAATQIDTPDALYSAIAQGDTPRIVQYLADGGDPDTLVPYPKSVTESENSWRGSLLLVAVLYRKDEIARQLLSAGASPEPVEAKLHIPLPAALIQQNMRTSLQEVLRAHPNRLDEPTLAAAAQFGRQDIIEDLIAHAAKHSISVGNEAQTALRIACARGHEDIARYLIPYAADPTAQDILMAAISGSNAGLVLEFLELGNRIAAERPQLSAAFELAIKRLEHDQRSEDAQQIANLLVDQGANACEFVDRVESLSARTLLSLHAAAAQCDWQH